MQSLLVFIGLAPCRLRHLAGVVEAEGLGIVALIGQASLLLIGGIFFLGLAPRPRGEVRLVRLLIVGTCLSVSTQ